VTSGPSWAGNPMLEQEAARLIQSARASAFTRGATQMPLPAQLPPVLTTDERTEAEAALADMCRLCAGIHAGSDLACPRLASFKLDGDGNVREGTFWRDGEWDTSRVLFAADAVEEDKEP
jgi:hypothetical protein